MTGKKTFGDAIIASPFLALDVLVHTGVTLFGRRTNGSHGFGLSAFGLSESRKRLALGTEGEKPEGDRCAKITTR
jgi:hypothetical protein